MPRKKTVAKKKAKKKAAKKAPVKKKAAAKKKATKARVRKPAHGMTVTDAWDKLFRDNEALARKRGGKPLTDKQLVSAMKKLFVAKAREGKTTLVRVVMMRGCYNKGTGPWLAKYQEEVADGSNRPISYRYESDGTKVEPRSTSSVYEGEEKPKKKKAKTKKKAAKKKAAKKKAAKGKARAPKKKATARVEPKPERKTRKKRRRRRRKNRD